MSTQVAPTIPPRPAKGSKGADKATAQSLFQASDLPPRPASKRVERSVSPGHFPRSPLNEPFVALPLTAAAPSHEDQQRAVPRRPSVQRLPSVGQEGIEYAEVEAEAEAEPEPELEPETEPDQQTGSAVAATDDSTHTRSVAHDLHLHAPRPSLPKASATAQVQAVTRTDSSHAAAHGIGKPDTPSIEEPHERELLSRNRSRASFSRPESSASGGRRTSGVYGDEHGPAELGIRVPINPQLGDVQAPSPAPFVPSHTGQSADGQAARHGRKKSIQNALPPGSYGLHGHGVQPISTFDRDWYAKHPEEAAHEEAHGHGVYEGIGSGRGSFALSSDDLNRIVHSTASQGTGLGTTPNVPSYPDEESANEATAGYTSRSNSAAPQLGTSLTNGGGGLPAVESPLRKSSKPTVEGIDPVVSVNQRPASSSVTDEDNELKPSISRASDEDTEYRAPILAADEVAKVRHAESLQPAIHPRYERRSNSSENDHRSGDNTPNSRPSSRPSSLYGLHSSSHTLSRFISHHDEREALHTPLEDVDEYEPLFADEEGKEKAVNPAERFKARPELSKRRFPSQDIWEDAPSSVNHTATVTTPDLAQPQREEKPSAAAVFESPEAETARKAAAAPPPPREEEKSKLALAQEKLAARPSTQPRFPSRDIWEDSPDSQHLVTVVQSEPLQEESTADTTARPSVPPRPVGKTRNLSSSPPTTAEAPSVPPRPAKKTYAVPPLDARLTEPKLFSKESSSPTDLKKVPSIPDRPKPQIPPRPAKKALADGLSTSLSSESLDSQATERAVPVASPPLPKAKPLIPARPAVGSKIASLKGNFMNDLNQKLGLGPPKEKEAEPEPEAEAKPPLGDARKGRAKGPQRRAPAKSSAAPTASAFSFALPRPLWAIDHAGLLTHHSSAKSTETSEAAADPSPIAAAAASTTEEEQPQSPALAAEPLSRKATAGTNDVLSHQSTRETEGSSLSGEAEDATTVSKQTTATSDSLGTELEREPSGEQEGEASASTASAPLTTDE